LFSKIFKGFRVLTGGTTKDALIGWYARCLKGVGESLNAVTAVLEIAIGGSRFFACEACGMVYASRELAEACEEWCTSHGSCNLEITRHAVGKVRRPGLRLRSSRRA
jgi:hypothetical protein